MSPAKKPSAIPPERLAQYENVLSAAGIDRKGDVHPYTSVNGHMYSYLDQSGAMGLRLPAAELAIFLEKHDTTLFTSYGVVKKDWALVPAALLAKPAQLKKYVALSLQYTASLKPKATGTKKR